MEYGWWLASRASGLIALALITLSVLIGLLMAAKLSRKPAVNRVLGSIHEHAALAGLVAIAIHGITLLGDHWLHPGIVGITVPFAIDHKPAYVGLGIIGGYLAAALGLSFYLRNRIGAKLWRKAHRATILVYVLSVVHTLGAGTDAGTLWLRGFIVVSGAAVLFLFLARIIPAPKSGPRFRRFRVADIRPESNSVLSFELVPAGRGKVPAHQPGQFVPVRLQGVVRSYSLSCAPRESGCRISVKREPGGRVSEQLHAAVEVGDVLELAAPAGAFVIGEPSRDPLVLISAGIGATPLIAMLESLARERSERPVWWIHSARNGAEHAFRSEAQAHLAYLAGGHRHVRYTRPEPRDRHGLDYDAEGRLTGAAILGLGIPAGAEFRLCGPRPFVADLTAQLIACGVEPQRIRSESFGGPAVGAPVPTVPAPPAALATGPSVQFSRSGVNAVFGSQHSSLLEVAEANAVRVDSSCRIGSCHGCRAAVVAGEVRHDPEPLDPPPAGSALLCCAVPEGDVVLDA
jgi:ferredoxin-NADP reductase